MAITCTRRAFLTIVASVSVVSVSLPRATGATVWTFDAISTRELLSRAKTTPQLADDTIDTLMRIATQRR